MNSQDEKSGTRGIWIPIEIVQDTRLSWVQKALFMRIYYLDNDEGCVARNIYLGKELGMSDRQARRIVCHLKNIGMVYEDGFHGDYRVLRVAKNVRACMARNGLAESRVAENGRAARTEMAGHAWPEMATIINKEKNRDNKEDRAGRNSDPVDNFVEKQEKIIEKIPHKHIVDYLNWKAGTSFRHTSKTTERFIKARWNEGFRREDFEKVIDLKVKEWKSDPKMVQYLRPQTLFGTKFESYLQQAVTAPKSKLCPDCGITAPYHIKSCPRAKPDDSMPEGEGD